MRWKKKVLRHKKEIEERMKQYEYGQSIHPFWKDWKETMDMWSCGDYTTSSHTLEWSNGEWTIEKTDDYKGIEFVMSKNEIRNEDFPLEKIRVYRDPFNFTFFKNEKKRGIKTK